MKKRIVALLMCIAIVCCSFVSCADTEYEELIRVIKGGETRSTNPEVTLTLYCVCDYATPEAVSEVQDALNAITVKKFNTKIQLFLFTEDEYSKIVYAKAQEKINSYITSLDDEDRAKYTNVDFASSGVEVAKDFSSNPSLAGAGFDIFLMFTPSLDSVIYDSDKYTGEQSAKMADDATKMFSLLYESCVLQDLTNYFKSGYSKITASGYDVFQKAVTQKDSFNIYTDGAKQYAYAVPNNYLLGEYQYLIINTDVVKDYTQYEKLTQERLDWLTEDLIADKKAGKISVDNVYVEYSSYTEYEESMETFAVAKVTGPLSIPSLINNPALKVVQFGKSTGLNYNNCRESMWGISRAYDSSFAASGISESDRIYRCLDIIDLLVNDEDFRNTLQYGVKGTHYSLGNDGTAQASSNDYKMDYKYTGNLFTLYPSDTMSADIKKLSADKWQLAKDQNTDIMNENELK